MLLEKQALTRAGKICSGHGAEAPSRSNATATRAVVFHLPGGSAGVGDKPEVENARGLGAEVRVVATGLCAITQRSFLFIAHLVIIHITVVTFQAADMDSFTALAAVNSACACVQTLRTENEACALLQPRPPRPAGTGAGYRPQAEREKTHNSQGASQGAGLTGGPGEDGAASSQSRSKVCEWLCVCVCACVCMCARARNGNVSADCSPAVVLFHFKRCFFKCFADIVDIGSM